MLVIELLKGSLLSKTPLTDLVLNERQKDCVAVGCEAGTSLGDQIGKHPTSGTMEMTVRAIFHKSKNKLLFAEVGDDFVEFLISLLAIPLGGIGCLLGGATHDPYKNIENMKMSIADINEKYLKSHETKLMLLNPKLPFGSICKKNTILPLTVEEESPPLYFHESREKVFLAPFYRTGCMRVSSIKLPKDFGKYVRGPKMYMVTDDLTVTPMCAGTASGLSFLSDLKVPLSDVRDLELVIGSKEVARL
ncbi:hypothetical protein OROHE_012744 [Orobanche hederae]